MPIKYKEVIKIMAGKQFGNVDTGGGDFAADDMHKTTTNDSSSVMKWVVLGFVSIVLIGGLAFGANQFGFSFWGIQGETEKVEIDAN